VHLLLANLVFGIQFSLRIILGYLNNPLRVVPR